MEGLHTKRIKVILPVAFVVALLGPSTIGLAITSDANESNAYILETRARDALVAFVNEAKDLVLEQGRDKAIEVFNDPTGVFVREGHYIIAYDFNGTCLAHPYEPTLVGKNVLNMTDSNGVALKKNMREVAKRGSGFAYYVWQNPAHSDADELKLTYVLKVDEELWLAAGTYLTVQAPIFSNESREDLEAFVENARDFALNTTQEEALSAFNDINGSYVEGNRYIIAYDFEGNCLAHPIKQEVIGINRIDVSDPNGVEEVRDMIALAQNGEGFTYYLYPDPEKNMTLGFKLTYITNVNDAWLLGAGIYA
jgi:polar amino acid transport system substrate-binding protein